MLSRDLWNAGLAFFDPEAQEICQRLTAAIPQDSRLRSVVFRRFLAIAKAR